LKQASRTWNKHFPQFLEKHGLYPSNADPCVVVDKELEIYLAIYNMWMMFLLPTKVRRNNRILLQS